MIRFSIARAGAAMACAAMAFALNVAPVSAASITLNDSSCDSFSLTGTPPNQTLSCVVSNAPAGCTISGPTSGTINVPITLTAQCASGSPNAWTWTGGSCANVVTQSCSAVEGNIGVVTYTVTPRNNIGSGNTASTSVNWSNAQAVAPSGCTLAASTTNLPAAGGAVVLTATCTGGGAPTSYAWTGNSLPTPTTTNVQSTSITTTTTFTVTPNNAGGNGNLASVTVNVAGGGGLDTLCTGSTVLPIQTATWAQQQTWHSQDIGNFGDNTVWLFKMTVPPGTPTSTVIGRFTAFEFGGPNTPRQISISTRQCDFRTKDYTGVSGPLALSNGSTAEISYGVAVPFIFGPAGLTAGQTYYISVRNWQLDPTPQPSCGLTTCAAGMNDIPALP